MGAVRRAARLPRGFAGPAVPDRAALRSLLHLVTADLGTWGSSPQPTRTSRRRSPQTCPTSRARGTPLPPHPSGHAEPILALTALWVDFTYGFRGRPTWALVSTPQANPPGSPESRTGPAACAHGSQWCWMPHEAHRPLHTPRSCSSSSPMVLVRTSMGLAEGFGAVETVCSWSSSVFQRTRMRGRAGCRNMSEEMSHNKEL